MQVRSKISHDKPIQDWVPAAASADAEQRDEDEDEFGAKDFRAQMVLRPDHESRWVKKQTEVYVYKMVRGGGQISPNWLLLSKIFFYLELIYFLQFIYKKPIIYRL